MRYAWPASIDFVGSRAIHGSLNLLHDAYGATEIKYNFQKIFMGMTASFCSLNCANFGLYNHCLLNF